MGKDNSSDYKISSILQFVSMFFIYRKKII